MHILQNYAKLLTFICHYVIMTYNYFSVYACDMDECFYRPPLMVDYHIILWLKSAFLSFECIFYIRVGIYCFAKGEINEAYN